MNADDRQVVRRPRAHVPSIRVAVRVDLDHVSRPRGHDRLTGLSVPLSGPYVEGACLRGRGRRESEGEQRQERLHSEITAPSAAISNSTSSARASMPSLMWVITRREQLIRGRFSASVT